jgi:hypothetical protein
MSTLASEIERSGKAGPKPTPEEETLRCLRGIDNKLDTIRRCARTLVFCALLPIIAGVIWFIILVAKNTIAP